MMLYARRRSCAASVAAQQQPQNSDGSRTVFRPSQEDRVGGAYGVSSSRFHCGHIVPGYNWDYLRRKYRVREAISYHHLKAEMLRPLGLERVDVGDICGMPEQEHEREQMRGRGALGLMSMPCPTAAQPPPPAATEGSGGGAAQRSPSSRRWEVAELLLRPQGEGASSGSGANDWYCSR